MAFISTQMRKSGSLCMVLTAVMIAVTVSTALAGVGTPLINTTLDDFFLPGTQPDPTGVNPLPIVTASVGGCALCHADFEPFGFDPQAEPLRNWVGSMMGQATRDPVFYACLTIANQDAAFSGDLCLRCHTPAGWIAGKSVPTDGSALTTLQDFDGVNCHFCHRLVNPQFAKGVSPAQDIVILDALNLQGVMPVAPGSGQYIIDPIDVRRGPIGLFGQDPDVGETLIPQNVHFPVFPPFTTPPIVWSPYHRTSELCHTCHDVSNPLFTQQLNGSYALNTLGASHPTLDPSDFFPAERTFGEWSQSDFANGGVQMNGRFGGNHPTGVMETCQDCHMPDRFGPGCRLGPPFPQRPNTPQHSFNGGNTWVINAVQTLYSDGDLGLNDPVFIDQNTGLNNQIVSETIARAQGMLQDASDMQLAFSDGDLKVRIINQTGHKLPTGYAEGRRMWINVKFLDAADLLLTERGHYDFTTAVLTTVDTKLYEMEAGLDAAMAAQTGLPVGQSFHFILNNTILKDNRIPPRGFTNAGFTSVQAAPVNAAYADGQYWDDTMYNVPVGAASAVVTLYFQTTSKEYIEFLRDNNTTDNRGLIAFNQWVLHGMSAPVVMDQIQIQLVTGDTNGDGLVGVADLLDLLAGWGSCPPAPQLCAGDLNCDGVVNVADLLLVFGNWS